MPLLAELRARWRGTLGRRRFERDLDDELRDHIEREVEARVARGMTAADARDTTIRDFGAVALHKDEVRRSLGVRLWDDLCADVRYAFRSLSREPGFAGVIVLTLALGIGANMTIYSAVDAVLLRPLVYPDQDRLFELRQADTTSPDRRDDVSPANFLDWQERGADVVAMSAIEPYSRTYSKPDGPERVRTWLVTERFFQVLGVSPILGRTFTPDEFAPGRDHVLVLGYGFWMREFGGDAAVIGRSVVMDKEAFAIVGVMPPGFEFPRGRDVWGPKFFTADDRQRSVSAYYRVVARLPPGITQAAAQARLDAIAQQLRDEYPRENATTSIVAVPLKESIVGGAQTVLMIFVAGVGLLLIVAAVNVSNLMLVRLMRRDYEFGVRLALGASAGRVRRQVLTESLVLAAAGALAATALAAWSTNLLRTIVPATFPRADQMTVGWTTVLVGGALAVVTAIAVSVVTMSKAGDARLSLRLTAQPRTTAGGGRSVQRVFVASELAVAMILLVTSGLFVRSLVALLGEPRGFRTDNVAVAVLFAWQEYPRPEQRAAFIKQVVDRVREVPGVIDAGAGSSLPLAERIGPEAATISVAGSTAMLTPVSAQASIVTPGYVEALGIPLIEGRAFTWFDEGGANQVVLINQRLARQYFPDRSPIGRRMTVRFGDAPATREIVGVVGDVRRVLARPAAPAIYVPHAQSPTGSVTFVAHTNRDASALLPDIKRAIAGVNGSIAVTSVVTLDELLRSTVRERRFSLQLVGFFALASLLLATIGAYGVMAAVANQRRKEIGIRVALGANRRNVVGVILADGARITLAGVCVGLVMAGAATRFVRDLLYGIQPLDPATYALSAVLIAIVSAVASGVPALRAAKADAVSILRAD